MALTSCTTRDRDTERKMVNGSQIMKYENFELLNHQAYKNDKSMAIWCCLAVGACVCMCVYLKF